MKVISWNTRALVDENGVVTRFIAIGRDITRIIETNQALRKSEEKYRRFFNTSRDCVFITSLDGRLLDINDAGVEFFGYPSKEELMEVGVPEFYANPEDRKKHIQIIVEKGYTREYPVDLRKKDGTVIHTLITSVARKDENGNVIGFQGTMRDVTELKRAQETLILAGKKLNLMSSVTRHDVLNQVTALLGYLELAREATGDPKVQDYIRRMERTADTIQHQLMFTREYQDIGIKAPIWQNIHDIVFEASRSLNLGKVRLVFNRTDLEIYADPLLLRVFYNLMDNALLYGGSTLSTISISSRESDRGLILTFEDDGAGITSEEKVHLFERGFGKHSGFGLFLSREILSITGISICETGEPGRGARFEISLPKGGYRFRAEEPGATSQPEQ